SADSHQHFRPDRQLAYTHARRVKHRVRDRGADTDRAELADAARADRIDLRIELLDERHVDLSDVGIHRHEIAREILRQEPAEAVIHRGMLEQCLSDAPRQSANHLAARSLRIDDPARAVDADDAAHSRYRDLLVDAYLGEHGTEAEERLVTLRRRVEHSFRREPL